MKTEQLEPKHPALQVAAGSWDPLSLQDPGAWCPRGLLVTTAPVPPAFVSLSVTGHLLSFSVQGPDWGTQHRGTKDKCLKCWSNWVYSWGLLSWESQHYERERTRKANETASKETCKEQKRSLTILSSIYKNMSHFAFVVLRHSSDSPALAFSMLGL